MAPIGNQGPLSDRYIAPSARILLISQNSSQQQALHQRLAPHFEVLVAASWDEGMAIAHTYPPHLILADYAVVLQRPKSACGTLLSLVPLILLLERSAPPGWDDPIPDADDYLTIPCAEKELLTRIQSRLQLTQFQQAVPAAENGSLNRNGAVAMDVLENITDGYFALDQEWRFTYLNRAAVELSGIVRDDVLGKSIWEVYPQLRGTLFETQTRRAIADQVVLHFETPSVKPGLWREIHLYPKPQGLDIYWRDITDRKRAEAEHEQLLRDLENERIRLEAVIEQLPVGVIIAQAPSGEMLFCNTQAETLWGGPMPMLPSIADYSEYQGLDANGHPYAIQDWPMTRAIQQGETVTHEEIQLRCGDGSVRTMAVSAAPVRDRTGQIIAGILTFQDITTRQRAEEALRLSESRYRMLANAVPQLLWVNAPDGNIQFYNQQWLDYTGQPLELGVGLWRTVIHPDDFEAAQSIRTQAIQAGQPYEVECRLRRFDGHYHWYLARIVPVKDEQGQVVQWLGTATDIHTQKETQAALRESEAIARARAQELEVFMETVPAGVWIAHDPECHHVTANRAAYQLLERPSGSTVTATPADGTYPFPFHFEQDGQPLALEDLPMQRAGRLGEEVEDEFDVVFADGRVRTVWGRVVPLKDDQGQVRGVIGAFTDISDRKRAERSLREREQRFSALFNGMEDWGLVYHLLPDGRPGRLIEVNDQACKRLGYSREELLSMSVLDIIDPAFVNADAGIQTLLEEKRLVFESLHIHRDGHPIPCEVSATLFTLNGLPTVQSICRDITERQQAEQDREQLLERERQARAEAERANRIKDEFLAILSHELRSPLNPILGWASLLQSRKVSEATLNQALQAIERNVRLQVQLVDDLLDVSRILRGKLALTKTPVDLVSIIQAAIETVQIAATAKGISVELEPVALSVQVLGDASRLQQVIWNLLSNAVKFTPNGGTVAIHVKQTDTTVQVQVNDTGKGINPEFLPHIFEHFRQQDSTTTRQFGGLGLGLAIVRYITEMHGGSVAAHSLGENQGATFTVELPRFYPTAPHPGTPPPPPQDAFGLQGLRILVVEDNGDTRDFLAFFLEQHGAVVTPAASATEALTQMAQQPFDLLVSDISMPDLDGYMLIRQIRERSPDQGGTIPAIALTAFAGEQDRQRTLQAGFQVHLAKPILPNQLIDTIIRLRGQDT